MNKFIAILTLMFFATISVAQHCTGPLRILVEGSATGSPLTLEFISQDVYCLGTEDGAIEVIITGGSPDYSCQWDNGDVTPDIVDLAPGSYAVTVSDENGCTSILSINILEINPVTEDIPLISEYGCGFCYLDDGGNSWIYSGDEYQVKCVDVIDGISMAQTDVCTYFFDDTEYFNDNPVLTRYWDIDATESNAKISVYFTGDELKTFAFASGYSSIQQFVLNARIRVLELNGGDETLEDYQSFEYIDNPKIFQSDIPNDVWAIEFFTNSFGTFYIIPTEVEDPLLVVSFEGWLEGPDNHLRWITQNETISKSYTLERSLDGDNFTDLYTVDADNEVENEYNYIDRRPHDPSSYYRLRHEDLQGKSIHSHIIHLKREKDWKMFLLQNPISNWVELRTENFDTPHSGEIFITDDLGQVLYSVSFQDKVVYSERVNVTDFPSGAYYFTIVLSDMVMKRTFKFMKI